MENRKALFFDIDGTLFSETDRNVPESASRALEKARSRGHLVFVNTGRTWCETEQIRTLVDVDGWLCGCGTYIVAEGSVLYDRRIPKERGEEIKAAVIRCGLDGVLEGVEACYMQKAPSPMKKVEDCRKGFMAMGIISDYTWDDTCYDFSKFCLMTDENSRMDELKKEIGLDMEIIDRGDDFFEIVPKGHSKATAIEMILKRFGLEREDAWVFGDSMNDLPMFQYALNKVLMGKHDRGLEPYATFVTKTVEEDGIAYAMETLGLI